MSRFDDMDPRGDQDEDLWINSLIATQPRGMSLRREFYTDPRVFERDLQRIYLRHWLFVGHASRIRRSGDYFVVPLAESSLIVVRGEDDRVRVFANVCRHRGSLLCSRQAGNSRTFVCPYHAWTYDTTGKLIRARDMPVEFERSSFGLQAGHVRLVDGLIFVSLAQEPLDLDRARRDLAPYLAPHGFELAKVAARREYTIDANWKLVLENFLECYHCPTAHPEYCRVNPRAHLLGLPNMESRFAEEMLEWIQRARALGHTVGGVSNDEGSTCEQYGANRVPLGPGFHTSSENGQPLAPVMGTLQGHDGGQTQFSLGPVSYGVADCDHAVLFRFLPFEHNKTSVELTWLVNGASEEGTDYALDRLTWLWTATFEQDRIIINGNQRGVDSEFYEPGPYSQTESVTQRWIERYLTEIK